MSRAHTTLRSRLVTPIGALIVATGLFGLPGAGALLAEDPAPTLTPSIAGDSAVREGNRVRVGGTAPSGNITSAYLVGIGPNGEDRKQDLSAIINRPTVGTDSDYLVNLAGVLDGQVTLACEFADSPCHGTGIARWVRVEVTVGPATGRSPAPFVRVDNKRPVVRYYELLDTTHIRVMFTEPVRHKHGDAITDWEVTSPSRNVVAVSDPSTDDCIYPPGDDASGGASGCTRVLTLDSPVDGDAPPLVRYTGSPGTTRSDYDDFASNLMIIDTNAVKALDKVPPVIPSILKIDNKDASSDPVKGTDDTPTVQVGNLRDGYTAEIFLESAAPSSGFDPAKDTKVGSAQASEATVDVTISALARDDTYTLYARSIDAAGNPSTGANNGADSAVYILDTIPPALIGAVTSDSSTVVVQFSESVSGTDAAAHWTIRSGPGGLTVHPVAGVAPGDLPSRRNLAATGVPAGATVTYTNADDNTAYRDGGGSRVPNGSQVVVSGRLPPVVNAPSGRAFSKQPTFPIQGTAEEESKVRLFVDDDNNGQPDPPATPVAEDSLPSGDTTFTLSAPLTGPDGTKRFLVQAQDASQPALVSGYTEVPDIVKDTTLPQIQQIVNPAAGEQVAGGQPYTVRWKACDANFPNGPMDLEISTDDGASWSTIAENVASPSDCAQTGSYAVPKEKVPAVATLAARVRLTATDLAGNSYAKVSDAFTIDISLPAFTGLTVNPSTVVVQFTGGPVVGSVSGADWRVKGVPATAAVGEPTGGPYTRITLTGPFNIGVNEEPPVQYQPAVLNAELKDQAGNGIRAEDRTIEAADGIMPMAPTVAEPAGATATASTTMTLSGSTEVGTKVRVFRQGLAVGETAVVTGGGSTGPWSISVPLILNAENAFTAVAIDTRNLSPPATVPTITQDASPPEVEVFFPTQGDELVNDRTYTITFRVVDVRLAPGSVKVEYSLDGGRSFIRLTPNSFNYTSGQAGEVSWRTPMEKSSEALIRVSAQDQFGRVGTATSGIFGIGVPSSVPPVNPVPPGTVAGYWLVAADGGVFSFGDAPFLGSTGSMKLALPVVGMAATPSGNGYWMVARDGGLFAFGTAGFYGSTGGMKINQPIVGMAPTPTGRGYWLVAADGGLFAYGDAGFYGSTGGMKINQPIVGMAATRTGRGYWMVARDGGIFAFGDATFQGSMGSIKLNQPVVGIAPQPKGNGYRMVAADGGIFAFGDAPFRGSTGGMRINQPIVGMATTPSGLGYWMVARDGGMFAFGDGAFLGSMGGKPLNQPMVGMAPRLVR